MNIVQRYLSLLIAFVLFHCSSAIAQQIGTAVIKDKLSNSDSVLTSQRMRLNTLTSACSSPKLMCPGYFGNTSVYYKTYTYVNESPSIECINVKMQVACASQVFCSAYHGSFDPADVCNNYIADLGFSIAGGGNDSMSFEVASGAQYCIVISAINLGDTCEAYVLSISQFATSWHGSIVVTDSTQTQRLYLDGIRNTCQNAKVLCANTPIQGIVNHDCYFYRNETPNDICLRTTLYHHCSDSSSTITSAAYINGYDSTNACLYLAADAGVRDSTNDSLWYTFLVPASSNCIIVVYSQKDSVFCDDYVVKLEADYTVNVDESNSNNSTFHLYPNPVLKGENLTIETDVKDFDLVEVYDVTSRNVFSKQLFNDLTKLIIPTSSFNRGIYLVKVSGEKETITRKVIVE